MFDQLDANGDGSIDLAEFTRFCLEVRTDNSLPGATSIDRDEYHPSPAGIRIFDPGHYPIYACPLLDSFLMATVWGT